MSRTASSIARDITHAVPLDDVDVDNVTRGTLASMVRPIHAMRATSYRLKLANLRAPTLVISTTRDRIVLAGQAEAAAKGIPRARHVVLDEAGHCPMIERPDEFNRLVLEFLCQGHVPSRPPKW